MHIFAGALRVKKISTHIWASKGDFGTYKGLQIRARNRKLDSLKPLLLADGISNKILCTDSIGPAKQNF